MSVRLRLTLLYGLLFMVAGGLLLGVTYVVVAHSPWPATPPEPSLPSSLSEDVVAGPEGIDPALPSWMEAERETQRDDDLRRLLLASVIALCAMGGLSAVLGWLMAGRALRPVATITARTRRITADRLHERLAGSGPDDELKQLSDTIDELLDRLETAFESQRRFVAHASHELRTPLTLQRAAVQVALAAPGDDVDGLRAACRQVLAATEDQERLIEALLALARSQRGIDERRTCDLAALTTCALEARQDRIGALRLNVDAQLPPTPVSGDPQLLQRLVANLVDNAVTHNVEYGRLRLTVRDGGGHATLEVSNSGAVVAPQEAAALVQPFRRGAPGRSTAPGLGIGLSIVDAVVTAHGGRLGIQPAPGGGLAVTVTLPRNLARGT